MTKVYNVTRYGITEQIISKLDKAKQDDEDTDIIDSIASDIIGGLKKKKDFFTKKDIYICPAKDGSTVNLTIKDIIKISQIIDEKIFVLFPSLNTIYDYFIRMTKITAELGIPLTWITPAGMKITQHYLKTKQSYVASNFAGRRKKIVYREWTNIMNKIKQNQACIPNIIHSLDATHLIKIILKAIDDDFSPIITVHDCFGTHPNKMGELEFRVKKEFVLLYTQENFLDTFHNRIIQSILDNKHAIITEDGKQFVFLYDSKIDFYYKEEIPSIPKLGKLDLEKIIHSKYMIN